MGIAKALGVEKVEDIFAQTEALNKKAAIAKKAGKGAGKAVKAGAKTKAATKAIIDGKAAKAAGKAKAAKDLAKKTAKKKTAEVEDLDNSVETAVTKKAKGKGKGLKKKKEAKDTEKVAATKQKGKGKDKKKDKDEDFKLPPADAPFFKEKGADSPDFKPKVYLSLEAIGYVSGLDQREAALKAEQAATTPPSSQEPSQRADEQQKTPPPPPPPPAPQEQVTNQAIEVEIEKVRDERKVKPHHLDPQAMFSSMRKSSGLGGGSDDGPSTTPINPFVEAAKKAEAAPSMNELIRMHSEDKK